MNVSLITKNNLAQLSMLTGVMAINYILYCTKDTLIVHHIGPEAVVFLRTYLVLPFIFIFFLISNRLASYFGMKKFFIGLVALFITFQVYFSFYLYPNLDALKIRTLENPSWLIPFYQLFTLWPLTLFYLFCEIWVVFVLGVITWQAINSINTVDSAKKSYHSLQFFSNLIILLTSQMILLINYTNSGNWCFSLKVKSILMIPLGLLVIISIMNLLATSELKKKSKKSSTSLISTLKMIAGNNKARGLFLLILFYAFCNTFSETVNRFYIKNYSSDIISYNNVMAAQSSCIGLLTIGFIVLGAIFTRYNLQFLSMLTTPLFVFTSTLIVLLLYFFVPQSSFLMMWFSVVQLSVIKSSKYGLIDPVKECCYLELDDEMKSRGKSFIDGVSNRSGKTLGNCLQQLIFIATGEIGLSLIPILIILATASLFWIYNTKSIPPVPYSEAAAV